MHGEDCVSRIMEHIMQPYIEVSLFREHKKWFLIQKMSFQSTSPVHQSSPVIVDSHLIVAAY